MTSKVTDKEYSMDGYLQQKLDLMISRCTGQRKMDNLLIIDGDEGYGKTTHTVGMAYYVSHITGRSFSVNNIFFDTKSVIDFAKSTADQIIIFDEAAFGCLAANWQSKLQKDLKILLMVARKKRHFMFFCIPKFFTLGEYFIVDRSIGLVHVYAKNELELGRFAYFNKRQKELLFYDWRKRKQRSYGKFKSFFGKFPDILGELIDEVEYDRKKDAAILTVGEDVGSGDSKRDILLPISERLEEYLKDMDVKITKIDISSIIGVNERTLRRYRTEAMSGMSDVGQSITITSESEQIQDDARGPPITIGQK